MLAAVGWHICAMDGLFLFDIALLVATCRVLSLSTIWSTFVDKLPYLLVLHSAYIIWGISKMKVKITVQVNALSAQKFHQKCHSVWNFVEASLAVGRCCLVHLFLSYHNFHNMASSTSIAVLPIPSNYASPTHTTMVEHSSTGPYPYMGAGL